MKCKPKQNTKPEQTFPVVRIHFVDHDQDFLWWDLLVYGPGLAEVIDCGPFQVQVWKGNYVLSDLRPRCKVRFSKGPDQGIKVLNYRIARVEDRGSQKVSR